MHAGHVFFSIDQNLRRSFALKLPSRGGKFGGNMWSFLPGSTRGWEVAARFLMEDVGDKRQEQVQGRDSVAEAGPQNQRGPEAAAGRAWGRSSDCSNNNSSLQFISICSHSGCALCSLLFVVVTLTLTVTHEAGVLHVLIAQVRKLRQGAVGYLVRA